MPLSEDEQRILAEIERNLHESDPRLAREVSETTVYRFALGSLRWTILAMVAGIAVMVATLQIHYLFAFVGFLLLLAGAVGLERNLRLMGRAGVDQFSRAFRAANGGDASRADEATSSDD
jgi:hypothetical protein